MLVGVKSADEVEQGFATIMANAKKYNDKATLVGVQVQQMLQGGQEVIVGAVTDPSFGKLVAFGLGGILVEVLKDMTFRLAPATQGRRAVDARRHRRGRDAERRARRRAVNRDALATMIQNVSQLVTDFPEISELDLNPVFATKKGAIAADVRIVIDRSRAARATARATTTSCTSMNRIMKPDAVAVIGASAGSRQDRQLGDEEPDQRRLSGQDLSDPPEGRRDHGPQGLQERQGRAGRHRRRRVRDPRQVRRAGAGRSRREGDSRRRADSVGLRRDRQRRGPEGNPGRSAASTTCG